MPLSSLKPTQKRKSNYFVSALHLFFANLRFVCHVINAMRNKAYHSNVPHCKLRIGYCKKVRRGRRTLQQMHIVGAIHESPAKVLSIPKKL